MVLQNEDSANREVLAAKFEMGKKENHDNSENIWEQIHISMGIAVYNRQLDFSVNDTVKRADQLMYENKRVSKKAKGKRNSDE